MRWNSLVRDLKHGEPFPSKGSADRVRVLTKLPAVDATGTTRVSLCKRGWMLKHYSRSWGKGQWKKSKNVQQPSRRLCVIGHRHRVPFPCEHQHQVHICMHKCHRIAAHVGTEAREIDGMGWRLVGLSAALLFCPVLACFHCYGSRVGTYVPSLDAVDATANCWLASCAWWQSRAKRQLLPESPIVQGLSWH